MALPLHPLSMAAKSDPAPVLVPAKPGVRPMGGSRRRSVYLRQGAKSLSPAQARRLGQKVRRNGYIPKAVPGDNGGHSST